MLDLPNDYKRLRMVIRFILIVIKDTWLPDFVRLSVQTIVSVNMTVSMTPASFVYVNGLTSYRGRFRVVTVSSDCYQDTLSFLFRHAVCV